MKSFHADSMAQDLKSTMRLTGDWEELRPDAREVLDRLQSAIGRIIAGEGGEKFRELLNEAIDADLPDEIADAIEAFNKAVAGVILSWQPGKTALDLEEDG